MYCIECGVQIPENSKFCQNCGKPQKEGEPSLTEQIAGAIIQRDIHQELVKARQSSLDFVFLRKAAGWYLAWVVLHLGFLLIASEGAFDDSNMGSKYFWPFGRYADLENYDITELLVYTIFPFVILVIISLVKNDEATKIKSDINNPQ